ncbi:conserved hypothetical protein [Vibrio nigripulchritudo SFn27]|uniref:Uncharacterized protein n=1 Tax=Vibrio nigripulchritudo TaxID=28173 RepID=U4KFF7_9VIBR|nr:hypothetical protein [Vibrio nigripulchritudo]CCN81209.1 conserved hypothetical protein [Vibrio nigripulchritudo BLFn1]CCN88175.1 conserved hypothetical protein [Vibrio nigripulchritudo SFn27]CCN96121.1 conserved hypothetical protein [Vibrio nigripulchritudo ENn2]CCO42355.1 conserved hypothetical protein [Vibrio nigripulchritudo SFn135]CCO53579.1 conserved hypothetical protein [Vibrio nigripulchritudo Wn13]
MAERFCKLNRRDINASLGEIHALVATPKFLCRSCARSSSDKKNLCKPAAIPPASCMKKAALKSSNCGLVAESLAADKALASVSESPEIAAQSIQSSEIPAPSLVLTKKALKKQKKYQKKLKKMLKKQKKLLKKHKKLEKRFSRINQGVVAIQAQMPQNDQIH